MEQLEISQTAVINVDSDEANHIIKITINHDRKVVELQQECLLMPFSN
jgi:hypothetical protein